MKKILNLLLVVFGTGTAFAQQSPDKIYGPLFKNVQMPGVFPDQKTFVDCLPIRKPSEIMADYERLVKEPNFDLKAFVAANFTPPPTPTISYPYQQTLGGVAQSYHGSGREFAALTTLPIIVPGGRLVRSIIGTLTSRCWG